MVADVAFIIKKILLESGKVYLPGYGSFVLQRTPAQYLNIQNKINPPSNKLVFLPELKEDEKLLNYIQQYYAIDSLKAKQCITDFTQTITSQMTSSSSKFQINELGTFSLENDQLVFEGNENLSNWFTQGLLPVVPIIIKKDDLVFGTNELREKIKDKDHTWRWLPFIFILCLLTFSLKYYTEYNKKVPQVDLKKEVPVVNIKKNNKDKQVAAVIEDSTDYCIIITGYFTEAKNILKMVDRIEALGYEVFMEDIADGTRVGLRIDCTNMDLKQKIYNIRDTISKEAWYLEPPLTIE